MSGPPKLPEPTRKRQSDRLLERTALWDESYRWSNPDLLALPGVGTMQMRVLGPRNSQSLDLSLSPIGPPAWAPTRVLHVSGDVVDVLLALGLMNMELYLSKKLECASTSTGSPIGDCVALKLPRLDRDHPARPHLWSFLEIAGVPDLSELLLADEHRMAEFLKITRSADAQQFRSWFHSNANLSEREILKAYIDLLQTVPLADKTPVKTLRFAITTAIDVLPIPLLGTAASFVDSFVVDKLLPGRSPKFFVENLRNFSGRIGLR